MVLEKIRELVEYGYGRLEVVVRDHQVKRLDWQKTMVSIGLDSRVSPGLKPEHRPD